MYARELTKRVPGRRTAAWLKGAVGCDLDHVIAVASREAERIKSSLGETTARTCGEW